MRRTEALQHHIETGDTPPIQQSPRRVPITQREEIKRLLKEMELRK